MISVIISKYHLTQIDLLRRNIEDTIGVPFEIIAIENGKGAMGLCEVYNRGAAMAKYEILCYSHEDIEIQSIGWGKKAVELFCLDERLGLLGLAGAAFKAWSPSGWWHPYANPATIFSNYIQSDRSREKHFMQSTNVSISRLSTVVCVDGFWFCTRRKIARELRFDEETFRGFHCYDIDFSLTVFQHYTVAVTYDIMIRHFSEGSNFTSWVEETIRLHRKWNARLPFDAIGLRHRQKRAEEQKAFDYFLLVMIEYGFPLRRTYGLLWSGKAMHALGLKRFFVLNLKTAWRAARRLVRGKA